MAYKPNQTVGWRLLPDGSIDSITTPERNGGSRDRSLGYQASPPSVQDFNNRLGQYPYRSLDEAKNAQQDFKTQKSIDALRSEYDKKLSDITSKELSYNTLADQIRGLTGGRAGGQGQVYMGGSPNFNEATGQYNQPVAALGADRNFGASDLSTRLNFQVSDSQILDDYNNTKLARLNNVVSQGNAQITGITERLNSAKTLLDQLPAGDPRRTSSDVYVNQLKSDLASVQSAVTDATNQIKDFKPITVGSPEAAKQITSFREYLQLPEERATQQLRQIDPETYRTAVSLGRQYREMATRPIGETTSAQTAQLRSQIEQEAINQLALGSQLGAEEQRQYQQAARAAQAARGNVFGVAPAVEEAVQTGAAGEARKLARYGAAQQFLSSGQTTEDAIRADLAFRNAIQQSRLGAAASFIGGGPSIYNLAQARTSGQQQAFQNYIQANQALPGQFGQAPSTAQNFYQATQPETATALTNTFANLYGSMADYQARTYGAYTAAQASRPTFAQQFGQIATGIGNLFSPFKVG